MKPAYQTQKRIWWKPASLVVMAAISAMLVTACGNKNNGGPEPVPAPVPVTPPGPVVPVCSGCPGNMAFLDSALGTVNYYNTREMEISLEFFGDGSLIQQVQSHGGTYAGPVAAQGTMILHTEFAYCGLPVGTYQVTTTQAGQWGGYGHSFGGMMLEASGPTQVRIYIPSAFITSAVPPAASADNRTFPYRISGGIQLQGMQAQFGGVCSRIMN